MAKKRNVFWFLMQMGSLGEAEVKSTQMLLEAHGTPSHGPKKQPTAETLGDGFSHESSWLFNDWILTMVHCNPHKAGDCISSPIYPKQPSFFCFFSLLKLLLISKVFWMQQLCTWGEITLICKCLI